MRNLSKASRDILRQIDSPMLAALEELRLLCVESLLAASIKQETEFDTIWNLAKREGKIEMLREFMQHVNNPT